MVMIGLSQDAIIQRVLEERHYQDMKWGKQDHDDLYWLGILTEELGETAKAVIEYNADQTVTELIQVIAVTIAWLECVARRTNLFQGAIIQRILQECYYRDSRWGEQNHDDLHCFGILTEKLGVTAKAIIRHDPDRTVTGLILVAAVAVAWLEYMGRRTDISP